MQATMMSLPSRNAVKTCARRSTYANSSSVRPFVRPMLRPLRFKEDDRKESLTEEAKGRGQQLKDFIQVGAGQEPEYDPSEPEVNPAVSAFTRRREIFSGRLAMVGFFAACFWEVVIPGHPNIMEQLSSFAGIGTGRVAAWLVILVAWNALTAVAPQSKTWSKQNQDDSHKRPSVHQGQGLGQLFAVSGWGFTKANELFNGRMAMLGFAAALIGQVLQGGLHGPGPLGQVANYLHINPSDAYYANFPSIAMTFVVLSTATSYILGRPGSIRGEKDIY